MSVQILGPIGILNTLSLFDGDSLTIPEVLPHLWGDKIEVCPGRVAVVAISLQGRACGGHSGFVGTNACRSMV